MYKTGTNPTIHFYIREKKRTREIMMTKADLRTAIFIMFPQVQKLFSHCNVPQQIYFSAIGKWGEGEPSKKEN